MDEHFASGVSIQGNIAVRPMRPGDLAACRALRLEALTSNPDAFSADAAEEALLSDQEMMARVAPEPPGLLLGGFAGDSLVGMAGYIPNGRVKTRHKATMVAVYVSPQARGSGLGRRLVEAIIDHARRQQVILQCTVTAHNHAARELYRGLGFRPYGLERNALCVEGRFFDEELLALDLRDRH